METDKNHPIRSPSPSQRKPEGDHESVEPDSHCLICYKIFNPSAACEQEFNNFTNPSTWQLLQVFCKCMGVQVSSDDEAEVDGIFCEKCHDSVTRLSRLDAELESIQKMISKVILECTVAVMESPRIAMQPDCQFLGRVRESIFNRYSPKISLRDCCQEEDRMSSDTDGAVSFASYMVPTVEMEIDEGNNDDDVIELTDGEEHQVPTKVEVVKRNVLSVDPAQALTKQHSSTSCKKKKGTSKRKKKIIRKVRTHPPVKRIFKEKPVLPPPTRELRDRGKIFKSDEVIILDGPSSSKTVEAPKYIEIKGARTKLEEIEPGKYLYLKRFSFSKSDDKFQCSSCDTDPMDSIEGVVSHIQLTHVSQQPPKRRRVQRKRTFSFYVHNARIDFDSTHYLCSLCPHKTRHRNQIRMHVSYKHYLPFLTLKRAGKVEGTLGEQPEDLTNKDESADNKEPKGSPRFEYIEDDEVSETDPEDSMSEEDEFIPEEITRKKMREEKKQNPELRLKLIEPGKYLYRNTYEIEKTEDGTYVCLLCQDRKTSRSLLLSHIKRVHLYRKESNKIKSRIVDIGNGELLYGDKDKVKITKVENKYSCGECSFLSEKLGPLREHIRNRHFRPPPSEPEPVICEECGKMLMGEKALRDHRDRMHSEAEKPFTCTTCGKGFVRVRLLKQHMRGHNKFRPKNFVCEHCGKAFVSNINLLSHVTTHTGETPFECNYCGKQFKNYNVMTVHRKACRTGTGQAPATQAVAPAECVVAEYEQPQQFPAPLNIAPHAPPPIPFEFFPALYGSGR